MDKLLTVIVQTSPLPSHPSTALIEALFRSFDRVKCLKDCNIIILCDGCEDEGPQRPARPAESEGGEVGGEERSEGGTPKSETSNNFKHGAVSEEAANNYRLHLELLHDLTEKQKPPFKSSNNGAIRLLKLPYRHGSARAIAAAFEILSLATPYVLIGQHDNFFVRDVDYLEQLLEHMEKEEIKSWLQCVHFPSTATLNYVQKVKRRYDMDLEPFCHREKPKQNNNTVSLCGEFTPLVFWYGRSHVARTRYYTEKILRTEAPLKVKDHLEEIWGTKQLNELVELHRKSSICDGEKGDFEVLFREHHAAYGNYVFFDHKNDGDSRREVLYHFSGRKARAATKVTLNVGRSDAVANNLESEDVSAFQPRENSFTTARMAMAAVPGLEFAPRMAARSQATKGLAKSQSKFRQRCFHCGEKGHSFKFCPVAKDKGEMPNIEILDLS